MRYEDWDVLLFPRDCKVPLKEFQVACHVVQDLEFSHTHGSAGVPTVCCFVPSLVARTPFQVSLHSWTGFPLSRSVNAYSNFADGIRYEARLYVDGKLVSSSVLDRNTVWPHVFTHSYATGKSGDSDILGFPAFRHELLEQSYWSPADNLGRIKLVISEGFPRNSLSNPLERVQNLVAFSFQHAPLDVLESSSIAWPSPSMWHSAPFAASLPEPTLTSRKREAEVHSPVQWQGAHLSSSSSVLMNPVPEPPPLDLGVLDCNNAQATKWDLPDTRYTSATFHPDDEYADFNSNKVPTNTPTASGNPTLALNLLPQSNLMPSSFAHSLTKSILNQPAPLQAQSIHQSGNAQAVRSRKENNSSQAHRSHGLRPAVSSSTGAMAEPQPLRKVSQTLSLVSSGSVVSGSTGGATLEDDIALSRTNSPLRISSQHSLLPKASFEVEKANDTIEEPVLRSALASSSGNTMVKGTKRARDFTPSSAKLLDEENEPRRVSPRLDSSSVHVHRNDEQDQ